MSLQRQRKLSNTCAVSAVSSHSSLTLTFVGTSSIDAHPVLSVTCVGSQALVDVYTKKQNEEINDTRHDILVTTYLCVDVSGNGLCI